MSAEKFQNKYRIASARLATWDYSSPGSYFITICTKDREHFFGNITMHKMQLNDIGIIATACWLAISDHYQNITLGEFVVMPNHIHGIIIIGNPVVVVETGHAPSLQQQQPQRQPQRRHTISNMIGSFKSAVTKLSKPVNPGFAWQTRFHDHIIRDHASFERISNYIINNPANWDADKFYR